MALSRRDLIQGAAGLVALPRFSYVSPRRQPFRIVHMTDFHVQPELNAPKGMAKALQAAMALDPKPDMVQTGGDLIMDSFRTSDVRAQTQWDLFNGLFKDNCDVPVRHCLGNHDVWGWDKAASMTDGTEPLWGKRRYLDALQIASTHYSYEAGGWKVVVLDTLIQTPDGYNSNLEPEQLDWLKDELRTDRPVMVVSHIPLITPSALVYGFDSKAGDWSVGANIMTKNFNDIKKLFDERPNVKLCVSGHIHLVDRYDYNGVSYLCNGAVCGAWWLGKHHDFGPGFVVIDLWPDGTWKHEFVAWGAP